MTKKEFIIQFVMVRAAAIHTTTDMVGQGKVVDTAEKLWKQINSATIGEQE